MPFVFFLVLLLFTPIYLTPDNLTPYIITPQSFNPANYSPRNRFNTEIFYLIRHPKEQLAKLKFKGLKYSLSHKVEISERSKNTKNMQFSINVLI